MRVASRITAISAGLFTSAQPSRIGSRSMTSAPGATALIFASNAASFDGRPSHGSCGARSSDRTRVGRDRADRLRRNGT